MVTIHKQIIPIQPTFRLKLSELATILHFEYQKGIPAIWYLTDTTFPLMEFDFFIFGTGQTMFAENSNLFMKHQFGNIIYFKGDLEIEYINTCIAPDGLVWHLFKNTQPIPTGM